MQANIMNYDSKKIRQIILVSVVIFVLSAIFSGPVNASIIIPGARDVKFDSVSCMADGIPVSQNITDNLWNPAQQQADAPGAGPSLEYSWNGSGLFECRWTFTNPVPWSAFEIESKLNANLTSVQITLTNRSSVEVINEIVELTPGKRIRAQLDDKVAASGIIIKINTPCPNGNCQIDLSEITPLAPSIDISLLTVNRDMQPRKAFLPGEIFSIIGGLQSRTYTCSGAIRSTCAWTEETKCKSKSEWWGTKRWCESPAPCPGEGFRTNNILFTSSQIFESGKCVSKTGWFIRIIGVVLQITGSILIYLGGATFGLSTVIGLALSFIGGMISAWNPNMSFSQQFLGMVISGAISATSSYFGGKGMVNLQNSVVSALTSEAIGMTVAAAQAIAPVITIGIASIAALVSSITVQLITPSFQKMFGNFLGSIIAGAVGATLGGVVSNAMLMGFASTFTRTFAEGMKNLAQNIGNFLSASARMIAYNLVENAVKSAINQFTSNVAMELCIDLTKGKTTLQQAVPICSAMAIGFTNWLYRSYMGTKGILYQLGLNQFVPSQIVVNDIKTEDLEKMSQLKGPTEPVTIDNPDPEVLQYYRNEIAKAGVTSGNLRITDYEGNSHVLTAAELKTREGFREVIIDEDDGSINYVDRNFKSPNEIKEDIYWMGFHLEAKSSLTPEQQLQLADLKAHGLVDSDGRVDPAQIDKIDKSLAENLFERKGSLDPNGVRYMNEWLDDVLKNGGSVGDFVDEVQTAKAYAWMQGIYDTAISAVQGVQTQMQVMMWLTSAQEQQQKALEKMLHGMACGCYGEYRANPQFLLDPVQCENLTYSGRNVSVVKLTPIGMAQLTSTGQTGVGWCERDVTGEGITAVTDGTISLILDNGTSETTTGIEMLYRNGISMKAPFEAGEHKINVKASQMITSTLAKNMNATVDALNNLPKNMTNLIGVAAQVEKLLIDVEQTNLYDAINELNKLNTTFYNILKTPISNISADMLDKIDSTINVLSDFIVAANNTIEWAGDSGHSTTILEIHNLANSTSSALSAFRNSLAPLDIWNYLPSGFVAAEKFQNFNIWMNNSLSDSINHIDEIMTEPVEIRWRNVLGSSYYCIIKDYQPNYREYGCRLQLGPENSQNILPSDINNISISWEVGVYRESILPIYSRWPDVDVSVNESEYKIIFRPHSGTFNANISLVQRAYQAKNAIEQLKTSTESAMAASKYSGTPKVPEYYIRNITKAKELLSEINSILVNLSKAEEGLSGSYEEGRDYIETSFFEAPAFICNLTDSNSLYDIIQGCSFSYSGVQCTPESLQSKLECSQLTGIGVPVLSHGSENSRQISIIKESAYRLSGISNYLDSAINLSTDAVWRSVLNKSGIPRRVVANISDVLDYLKSTFDNILESSKTIVENEINQSRLGFIASQMPSSVRDSIINVEIDVIKPRFEMDVSPSVACSPGEAAKFNITITPTAEWPVIHLNANEWTPFSIPFIPISDLRLSQISGNCKINYLAWWNESSRSGVIRSGNDARTSVIIPGRGYFVKSTNNCNITLDFRLFRSEGIINLTRFSPTAANSPILIGGGSSTIPFDMSSISNRVNWETLWSKGMRDVNINCPPLAEKLWSSFSLPRLEAAGNYTKIVEAISSTSENPFEGLSGTSPNPSGRLVDTLEPGKAYWLWTSNPEGCKIGQIDASLPTTSYGIPKPIEFNLSASLPYGWVSGKWLGGIFDTHSWLSCSTDDCAGMATTVSKTRFVKPGPSARSGDYIITFTVNNEMYNFSKSSTVTYHLSPVYVELSMSRLNSENFRISLTNRANSTCSTQKFFINIESPFGWLTNLTGDTVLNPGQNSQLNLRVTPTTRAKGGGLNVYASAETSERESAESNYEFACLPQESALDISSNGDYLFYLTTSGILAFDPSNCSTVGQLVELQGYGRGIAANKTSVIWIDSSNMIKEYIFNDDILNGSVRNITEVSAAAHHIAVDNADTTSIYWIDGNSILKLHEGSVMTVASNLSRPSGIDADDNAVYWSEKGKIRYTTGICDSLSCGLLAEVPQNLLGEGEISDLYISGNFIFAAVDSGSYSKVVRIDKISKNIDIAAKTNAVGISAVSADENYVWFAESYSLMRFFGYGINEGALSEGNINRVRRDTEFVVASETLNVPGHSPPTVRLIPSGVEGAAGSVQRFIIEITNNNSPINEPLLYFWLKDFAAPPSLKLCYSGPGFMDCEGERPSGMTSVMTRENIIEEYMMMSPTRALGPGDSDNISIWIKPLPSLAVGSQIPFNITIGSDDPFMDVVAGGTFVVTPPGAPQVVVIPGPVAHNHCGALPDGYINQTCTHPYTIEITNPEEFTTDYSITISTINSSVDEWNIWLENITVSVPGWGSVFGNMKRVGMTVEPRWVVPFGLYRFLVNVTNILFPERYNETTFDLIVTPDNLNGVCEPEFGENAVNTPDCQTDFICPFDSRCDRTTLYGVDFSAKLPQAAFVENFASCKALEWETSNMSFRACINDVSKARFLCQSPGPTNKEPLCNYACVDKNERYILLAQADGSWKSSPIWTYKCPECIGKIYSKLIQTDWWMIGSEYAKGDVTFDLWFEYIRGEHLRSDSFARILPECDSVIRGIVKNAIDMQGRIYQEIQNNQGNIFPVDGICSQLRQRVSQFINESDDIILQTCRQWNPYSKMSIVGINILNHTLGSSELSVEIKNDGNSSVYAKVECRYGSELSISGCKQLRSGEISNFTVPLTHARLGANIGECYAVWSTLHDCAVGVNTDSKPIRFVTVEPEPRLRILRVRVPDYALKGRNTIISIDINNSGGGTITSAICRLRNPDNTEIETKIDARNIGLWQSGVLNAEFVPNIDGLWTLTSCSVYSEANNTITLQDTASTLHNINVMTECSTKCQDLGYNAGECKTNADVFHSAGLYGEHGCSQDKICVCGMLSLNNLECRMQTGFDYSATGNLSWDIGSYATIRGLTFYNPGLINVWPLSSGVQTIDVILYSSDNHAIGRLSRDIDCVAPLIEDFTLFGINGTLWGTINLSVNLSHADIVDMSIDGLHILNTTAQHFNYTLNTMLFSDGNHIITLIGCNSAGCVWKDIPFTISNEGINRNYDFFLNTAYMNSTAVSGSYVNISFLIRNVGLKPDRFVFNESLSTDWEYNISLNGYSLRRSVILAPNESAVYSINIRIPDYAINGDYVDINMCVTSINGLSKRCGTKRIVVSSHQMNAPEIVSTGYIPDKPQRFVNLTFWADIISERDILDAKVCKDDDCNVIWCNLIYQNKTLGKFTCSVIPTQSGNFTYSIYIRDSNGLSMRSGKKSIWVSEQSVLRGMQNIAEDVSIINASCSIPSHGPEKILDRDTFSYWISCSGLPHWITIDMKQIKGIGGIGIFSRAPARPRTLKVETSPDCLIYNTSTQEQAAHYSTEGWYRKYFDAKWIRCIRIWVSSSEDGSDYTSVAEIEVYSGQKVPDEPKPMTPIEPTSQYDFMAWIFVIVIAIAAILLLFFRKHILLRLGS